MVSKVMKEEIRMDRFASVKEFPLEDVDEAD